MFFSSIGNHSMSEGNNTTPAPSSSTRKRVYPRLTKKDECISYLNTFLEESKKRNEQAKQERAILMNEIVKKQTADELLFASYAQMMNRYDEMEKMEIRMRVSQLFFEIEQRRQHPVDLQATRHTSASHMPTHLPAAWGTAADNNTYTTLKNL